MTDCGSFKFKSRLTNNANNAGIVNVEIAVPSNNLVIFRTHEMPPVNCEINIMLTWSAIVPFAKKIEEQLLQ